MRIVFLGSGAFGLPCLMAIQESRHELVSIVSQPPHPAGRGRKLTPTPIAQWAADVNIDCLETDNVNTDSMRIEIAAHRPDLLVVIAFGQKMGQALIDLAPKAAINVHASLLPKWRGAAPIQWAIMNGDTTSGVSIITLADRMDAGDILSAVETPIGEQETAGELHDRLAEISPSILLQTLDQIQDGTVNFTPQDHTKATLAPKLKKSDGYLDFTHPAHVLVNRIRGLWPWPGARADYISTDTGKKTIVTLGATEIIEKENLRNLPVGAFDQDLDVVCSSQALRILKVKPSGSPLMEFKAFVNGRHTRPGDRLLTPRRK